MNLNHLDARAITQPGGMYQGINDAVLQTVAAYLQSQDRERQGQRDLVREERANRQAQYRQALQDAASLGVAPSAENAGWLAPQDQAGIMAAQAKFQKAQADDALVQRMKRQQMIRSGMNPGDMTPDEARLFQQEAQRTALDDQRAGLGLKTDQVRLKAMQDDVAYNAPWRRDMRSVADFIGKATMKGIEAQGRQKEQKVPGLDSARLTLRDLDIAASTGQPFYGPNNQIVPADKIPAFRQALAAWVAEQERGAPMVAPSVGGAAAPPTAGPPTVNIQAIDDIMRAARAKLPVSAQIQ